VDEHDGAVDAWQGRARSSLISVTVDWRREAHPGQLLRHRPQPANSYARCAPHGASWTAAAASSGRSVERSRTRLSAALGEPSLDRREPILVGIAYGVRIFSLGKGCGLAAPAAAVTAALTIAAAGSASGYFGAIFVPANAFFACSMSALSWGSTFPLRTRRSMAAARFATAWLGGERILDQSPTSTTGRPTAINRAASDVVPSPPAIAIAASHRNASR
jgi:hypothetical protein